jgi:hypothetical protein
MPSQQERRPNAIPTSTPGTRGEVVETAVALIEAAALTAAMRRMATWNPLLHLRAAADRTWAPSDGGSRPDWRTDPRSRGADFRAAVLLAEAAVRRCVVEDGYLSARQLSVDLRHAAVWLAAGTPFDP